MEYQSEKIKHQKLESIEFLAAGIAHDFNNIIAGILGNLSLIKNDIGHDAGVLANLEDAERALYRAKDLIQQIIKFSKGGSLITKTVSIANLLDESVKFVLKGSNVKCVFSVPDDIWLVKIDEGQIYQVINNIIINALQAMPQGGTIRISVQNINVDKEENIFSLSVGRYLKVSIKDEGVGIPQEYLSHIFNPFVTTRLDGNGLGLSISYGIIKRHKGHMEVESKMGVGTTLTFYLPASEENFINQ